MKVLAREAFLIPLRKLDPETHEQAVKDNTFNFYKQDKCDKCPYLEDRPSDVCEGCDANLGSVCLAKEVTVNERQYLSLPIGDKKYVKDLLVDEDVEFVPQWKIVPMKSRPKFTGDFEKREYQPPAIKALRTGRRGVLKSDPRSGKTVMAAAAVCRLKLKTIIIAAQREWLENFEETFIGSKTQDRLTTIPRKRIGFPKKLKDFKRLDVALCTYQSFISKKGKKLLKKVRRMFSVMIVDEVHYGSATEHARVIAAFSCKYRWGLTGTPDRKDGKYPVMRKLMGPILHETEVPRLIPRLVFTPTQYKAGKQRSWTYIVGALERDPKRLKLIAERAIKDAKNGHMVLIPMTRVHVIKALTVAINKIANAELDPIAATFFGGMPKDLRKKVIQKARSYRIKILVGNMRLLSTGINIPRASCIYQCTPSSNTPKAEQRFSRILTPMADKPQPIIRVFADDSDIVRKCFRNEYWNVLAKKFKPQITDDTKTRLFDWMGSSTSSRGQQLQRRVGAF